MFKIRAEGRLISANFTRELNKQVEKAIEQAAFDQKARIIRRTQQGLNANESPFEPYSKEYAEFRADHGRSRTPVTLTWTGAMLRSIATKIERLNTSVRGILFFSAEGAKAAGNQRRRNFFDISAKDAEKIKKTVGDLINLKEANK